MISRAAGMRLHMRELEKNFFTGPMIFRIQTLRDRGIAAVLAVASTLTMLTACKHIDDDRTPPAGVWIVFATEPMWTTYGTPSALDTRRFILQEGLPQNFPYTAMMQTGYGGVLLVGDINGRPAAYDLSCPVENKPDIRIKVDEEHHEAYCPECGSRYAIYSNYGQPLAGPAADKKHPYGLRKYTIASGPQGEYRVIRP